MDSNSGGVSVAGLLLVLFIGLKLTGSIAWSWWWVLAPMWIPLVAVAILCIAAVVTLMANS